MSEVKHEEFLDGEKVTATISGQHSGAFDIAHKLAFQKYTAYISAEPIEELYDAVIVGGGISGLSAAHFYRKRFGENSRVLVLECLDSIGGHALRNEFDVDGKKLLSYGGSESFQSPKTNFSQNVNSLMEDLGIDLDKFETEYFKTDTYPSLGMSRGVFFAQDEAKGIAKDTLVTGDPTAMVADDLPKEKQNAVSVEDFIGKFPLSDADRAALIELWTSTTKVTLSELPSTEEKAAYLSHVRYPDFLKDKWALSDTAIAFFRNRTLDFFGLAADNVSALDAGYYGYPGVQGITVPENEEAKGEMDERYIHHFPDGNASLARLLLRKLIPASILGSTAEDIVLQEVDRDALDQETNKVRVRLGTTAVKVIPLADGGVDLGYIRHATQSLHRIQAKHCVLACFNMIIPFILSGASKEKKAALKSNVKAPLVYTNVALRNWNAWKQIGVHEVYGVNTFHSRIKLDYPVAMGGYTNPTDPSQPIVVHMVHVPSTGAKDDPRSALREARGSLFSLDADTYRTKVREDLTKLLGPAGFDFDRDVAAVTVNRWSHGYAWVGNSLIDKDGEDEAAMKLAREAIGSVSIANSDAGHAAYMHAAVDEAFRAVWELPDVMEASRMQREEEDETPAVVVPANAKAGSPPPAPGEVTEQATMTPPDRPSTPPGRAADDAPLAPASAAPAPAAPEPAAPAPAAAAAEPVATEPAARAPAASDPPTTEQSTPSGLPVLKERGSCLCGAVRFTIDGPCMGAFWCHCRACARSKGAGANLLVGVAPGPSAFTVQQGEDKIKTVKPAAYAPMVFRFCTECGSHVVEYPEGAPFIGAYPATFEYESGQNTSQFKTEEKVAVPHETCLLPALCQPAMHLNYENRVSDCTDDLPKFRNYPAAFGGDGAMLNSDGSVVGETKPVEEKKEAPAPERSPGKESSPVTSAAQIPAATLAAASPSRIGRYSMPDVSGVPVTPDQLRAAFQKFDTSGDGQLSRAEFKGYYMAMENFGLEPSEAEVTALFNKYCGNDEYINFDEFCILMLQKAKM